MIESRIDAVDMLDNAASDLVGVSDALCYKATIEGDDLSSMLSRVVDVAAEAVRAVSRWLDGEAEELGATSQDDDA